MSKYSDPTHSLLLEIAVALQRSADASEKQLTLTEALLEFSEASFEMTKQMHKTSRALEMNLMKEDGNA